MRIPGFIYDYFMTLDKDEMEDVKTWLGDTKPAVAVEDILEAIETGELERDPR